MEGSAWEEPSPAALSRGALLRSGVLEARVEEGRNGDTRLRHLCSSGGALTYC